MIETLPPALWLFAGALSFCLLPERLRLPAVLIWPALAWFFAWQLPDGVQLTGSLLQFELQWVEASTVRRLFATVFCLMTLVGGVYAYRHASRTELASAFAYAAGALGVCFAGDLITLFIFWEMMAIFSTAVVWCGNTEDARKAGIRYALVHLLGGVILKFGIILLIIETGSTEVRALTLGSVGTWLMLIGVLINAAAPPFSAWLADAYPEASPSGTVFLSAYTTKTAVLCLILLFPGATILIPVGLYMVFYGIIYALLENDMRRILAYSIVNQVGFMVCAIGIGTETAINGAAAHAFAHIIYKALLMMSAGAVLLRTGKRKCSDLGGLYQTMPLAMWCGVIGALAISSLPSTSGYTTKSLINVAAQEQGMMVVYFLLAAASAGVFLHAGIKFPWFVFFQKDSGMRPKDAPLNMSVAMLIMSAICLLLGLFPQWIYPHLPYPVAYEPYKADKLIFYFQLLLFSGLAFFLLLPWMKRTLTITLDTDWFYRRALNACAAWCLRCWQVLQQFVGEESRRLDRWKNATRALFSQGGVLAATWSIGVTVLLLVVLLTVYIVFYYLQ